jgi:hypothetical protein
VLSEHRRDTGTDGRMTSVVSREPSRHLG